MQHSLICTYSYINNYSSCEFYNDKIFWKYSGNHLKSNYKIIKKNYEVKKDNISISATHNGFEKRFGCIHERNLQLLFKQKKIIGMDFIKKSQSTNKVINYLVNELVNQLCT